ncbi:MAG: argininosuccinate lyase [Pyrinomonadaceae bacterium]
MTGSQKLWGGRFTSGPDETFTEFNNSFRFDRRLFEADVEASIAHAEAIRGAGVLSEAELARIKKGLATLLKRSRDESEFFDASDAEDVHSFIESELVKLVGDAGKKIHTGRSRNDQVATAFRLWLRGETASLIGEIRRVQRSLVSAAERHEQAVIPGYTHLQRAQPVLWAHWCLAYFEMLKRDVERLGDALERINVLPLGSGALAGSGFAVDRAAVAKRLGFRAVSANSLDAVSDRDFAVEFVGACSLLMMHLSRMAEDLIIYCSTEFGFVELSDAVSSGSSLMPQKKNPDALELLRGKAGRVFGHHAALLAVMKGLPLAYNKDMQEDKEAVFDTVDTVRISLRSAAIVLDNLTVKEDRAAAAASIGYLNATDLADYLVKKGVPFREAHEAVGRAVLGAISRGKELHELSVEELKEYSPKIGDDAASALKLSSVLAAKNVEGGTSPKRVSAALRKAKKYLAAKPD